MISTSHPARLPSLADNFPKNCSELVHSMGSISILLHKFLFLFLFIGQLDIE